MINTIKTLVAENPTRSLFSEEDDEDNIKLEVYLGCESTEHYHVTQYVEFDTRLKPLFALFSPFELCCNVNFEWLKDFCRYIEIRYWKETKNIDVMCTVTYANGQGFDVFHEGD